jgi:N-methylhydantoinase A
VPEKLREAFEAQHEDRYGYSDSEQTLELVTIRVTATVPGADVTLAPSGDEADVERSTREATIGGEQVELEVLRGSPPPGSQIAGPAAIDLPESTLIVPAEWSGKVDETGTIHLGRRWTS